MRIRFHNDPARPARCALVRRRARRGRMRRAPAAPPAPPRRPAAPAPRSTPPTKAPQDRDRDLVRSRLLRPADRLRADPDPGRRRRRQPQAALRHAREGHLPRPAPDRPVVDRGPYANGADWDLTAGAAQALGIEETVRIATRVVGAVPNTPTLGLPASRPQPPSPAAPSPAERQQPPRATRLTRGRLDGCARALPDRDAHPHYLIEERPAARAAYRPTSACAASSEALPPVLGAHRDADRHLQRRPAMARRGSHRARDPLGQQLRT